ncbi:hypothetical protein [Marinimicrobium locisalis]|uniref:hypothetical protein n=1 Tax=Marinimicrobium locisalis TaxID=546022 RepID=UPI003221ACCF
MTKPFVALVLFVLVGSPVSADDLAADFERLCGVFEEALTLNEKPGVMAVYLRDNLPYRVESKEVLDAYDAILLVDPSERYRVFKQAAEANMEDSWDCPAFKALVE